MDSGSQHLLPRLGGLRVFDTIAAHGTMSSAAATLRLTQPAVTRAIKTLELELGAELLERRRGGSFLTREGAILARRTRRAFAQIAAAVSEAVGKDVASDAVVRTVRNIRDVHIRGLRAIWTSGSFKGAAIALGLAEPSLQRPARELERLLRIPLYRRTVEGLGLTPTGLELARRFTLAMVEVSTAIEELAAHRERAGTTIRVGVLPFAPNRLLASAVEVLIERHPRSRIVIDERLNNDLVTRLRSGAIDFIFGALSATSRFDDLGEDLLFADPYRVVCRRAHPLLASKMPLSDIKNYGWVLPASNLRRRIVLDAFLGSWETPPQPQFEVNGADATIGSLVTSDRLTLLPRVCVEDNIGALSTLDVAVPQPARWVGITRRIDWLPTLPQADLIKILKAKCASRLSLA
ncbi:MAG TPA: LysR family transcriptional regulator [Xanthobacteraceae bacterium]|jgi:DNA-binding transcriptional LysR family regulator|nr:LysR family transcriptional regulator [Xanthobacteraceae bacterium]